MSNERIMRSIKEERYPEFSSEIFEIPVQNRLVGSNMTGQIVGENEDKHDKDPK